MSISDGLDLYILLCKNGKHARSMKNEMEGLVFVSLQTRHFFFLHILIKVLFPICTLNWHVNIYVSRQGKVMTGGKKSTNFII